jgi:hypothetical protein
MDKTKKKALRAQYDRRHPEMGIVCWSNGDDMWIAKSTDTKADYNGSSFQLELGSWPNREMQEAYNADPSAFQWSVIKTLDYEEREDDHSEDLALLYIMVKEANPEAKPMRPGKRYVNEDA